MPIHPDNIKALSAEDYRQIELEHARLERFLEDLHDTCHHLDSQLGCEHCGSEKLASCHGRMHSFLHDLLDITGKHFLNEENIMLSRPHVTEDYAYYRVHHQAHLKIMQALRSITDQCAALDREGATADAYRALSGKISALFEEHNRAFDDPFIQSTRAA
jgi:hemerythrin